jgi:hypothetical protein
VSKLLAALQAKTLTKVKEGFAKLIHWDQIKANLPSTFKLHPIAVLPHNFWLFCMILDLSFGVRGEHGTIYLLVNETTSDVTTPLLAMKELGDVLSCLIATLTNLPDDHSPVLFTKLDIKDNFWCLMMW